MQYYPIKTRRKCCCRGIEQFIKTYIMEMYPDEMPQLVGEMYYEMDLYLIDSPQILHDRHLDIYSDLFSMSDSAPNSPIF